MKRLSKCLVLWLAFVSACFSQVNYTSPQSQVATIFSAVGSAQASTCLTNQGQNIWSSSYIISGGTPTFVQYRLEFSYNSDAATCSTGTWFQMSDDAIEVSQGEVLGIGAYPFVRANLLKCVGCGGGVTLTATYSATSSGVGSSFGFYNPSQQVRKTIFVQQAASAAATATVPCPYGSAAGFILVSVNGALPANSFISISANYGNTTVILSAGSGFSLNPVGAPTTFSALVPQPATTCTSLTVSYATAGGGNKSVTAYYYFFPPGAAVPYGIQPQGINQTANTETVSAVNTAVSQSLELPQGQNAVTRAHLFSVSARCSAGTAQLTVTDGNTTNSIGSPLQIWSSAAGEVGVTTFPFKWNPALSSSPGNGIKITLGTCGGGNTGTLDIQGSVF